MRLSYIPMEAGGHNITLSMCFYSFGLLSQYNFRDLKHIHINNQIFMMIFLLLQQPLFILKLEIEYMKQRCSQPSASKYLS